MLKIGYYTTKGGHQAHISRVMSDGGALATVKDVGFPIYLPNGEFAYKDENYEPHARNPGDTLDLIIESYREHNNDS
jgi:hypothetical protein